MWLLAPAFAGSPALEPADAPDPAIVALRDRIADVRGHPFELVPFLEVDPEGAVAYMRASAERYLSREDWRRLGLVWVATDVLPERSDLLEAWLAVSALGTYGFYDPLGRAFVLVRRPSRHSDEEILGHELVHVLQDQVFDLSVAHAPHLDNADVVGAAQMVLEGEAALVGRVVELGEGAYDLAPTELVPCPPLDGPLVQTPPGVPAALVEQAMFAYPLGGGFVRRVLGPGRDWTAMDAVYAALPRSTEQVMHPERYAGAERDEPTAVTLSLQRLERALPGYAASISDSQGEYGIGLMFRAWGAVGSAWALADGWDGDRMVVLEDGDGRWALVWRLRWDTDEDARAFADAVAARWGRSPTSSIERRGPDVVVLRRVPVDRQPAVLAAAWAADLRPAGSLDRLVQQPALRDWVRDHPRP